MFPILLDLRNQKCLVVGGGNVAVRKVLNLLECGADLKVVSLLPDQKLVELAARKTILLEERAFRASDVNGCFLVFAATNDEEVNQLVFEICEKESILVNVVDEPERCRFFVPSTLRRGSLTVSVSTEGKSPLLARKMRENLENNIGFEYEVYTDLLGEARKMVKLRFANESVRKGLFEEIQKIDVLPLIKQGKKNEAKERILQCIYSWQE
ncbi:MAG: bifunctional precorrin-2 dehydrogenase/sirohydrochlorin ferrochelatase [Ignavibacteriales bacterium]